jgi:predicted phage baseplate assembly protein
MLAALEQGFSSKLPGDKTHSTLVLASPLSYCYKRESVEIYANVVKATHGETRNEVLGNGDGSRAMQTFALHQSPLTYLPAPTPAGAASTLEVRVNEVKWHEVDNLIWLQPYEHGFVTRTGDAGKTSVVFGDGKRGGRPPTGMANVRAKYRTGIGRPGNVRAGQISLLATRPLGVKGVTNPLPATGGADREGLDQARRNAPLAVMALDRLVSVRDYEDFARTYAGIGKASARRLTDGRRQLVHLTIAGAGDIPISPTDDLYRNLRQALHDAGDPYQPVVVEVRELLRLIISGKVRLHPDYKWEFVEPKIRAALLDRFSFERRDLGQDVVLSEVISTIQSVPGVAYVDVDALEATTAGSEEELKELSQRLAEAGQNPPNSRIVTDFARYGADGKIEPAQLAFLLPEVPDTLILKEITS